MVFSSHKAPETADRSTEPQLEAFAAAYYAFQDAGAELTLATPLGGEPPLGRARRSPGASVDSVLRFKADAAARTLMADTLRLDQIYAEDFSAVFVAGGLGAWWDLASDVRGSALISAFWAADKPIAFLGAGSAALLSPTGPDRRPIVAGRTITGLSDADVQASSLAVAPPFSLEAQLRARGALYRCGPAGLSFVVRDGPMITGQNPPSAVAVAEALLAALGRRNA